MGPLRDCYRLAALSLIALFCSTTPVDAQPPPREQPRFGGVLKVAMIGEPPSLDLHWGTGFLTWAPMWHVFETLYTFDKDWSPIPHLARCERSRHLSQGGHRRDRRRAAQAVHRHRALPLRRAQAGSSRQARPLQEYAARSEPPNGGAGGKRVAYLDELRFIPVPDLAVRLAGVESGSYHYSYQIKQDQYDRLLTMRSVEPRVTSLATWPAAVLNHKQGLMTGKKLRQAFQAALDMQPIMAAGVGHPLFYRLDPALFPPELVLWHSTAGGAAYNQKDKDKARRLLKEAGYAGQPIRWLTTQEFEYWYKPALVAKQQLEEVGFKIDLQVLDGATLVQRGTKPELFDVRSISVPVTGLDPALNFILQCTYSGWWCLEEKDRLLGELARETDPRKRKAIIDRIQVLFYEDVGRVKFGDVFTLQVTRKELRGDFRSVPFTYFWNAWLEKK